MIAKASENAVWNHTHISISGEGCPMASYETEEGEQ
jgi:hypothetical protein